MVLSALFAAHVQGQTVKKASEKQEIKVDFDFFQRRVEEVNDPTYRSWPITEQKEAQKSFDGLTLKLKGDFSSSWYKVGMSAPYYSRMASDGLVTKKNLELVMSGLPTGEHSLLTFHNTFDKIEGKTPAAIKIYVNNTWAATVAPTTRANATNDAARAYLYFQAVAGTDVVVRFETEPGEQMVLNGLELDTPDLKKQSRSPQPENRDEHVVPGEKFSLRWESPQEAVAHQVYYGEDQSAVAQANVKAAEYKGEQKTNTFAVPSLYSGTTYYWRVDEVDAKGTVTKGSVWSFRPAQLAFPGAEGYGRFAIGGRGGAVVEVTNLNDSGPGSLRDAVDQPIGPKTIVFTVSGNIQLQSRLVVNMPYITIAGQTAPGEGITISRAPVGLTGNDGIIRFLKVRIGAGKTFDGMGLTGADHSIIDHCSISWTIDESFSSRGAHHITLQRTLISEALNAAGHDKYPAGKMHGYAATIGGDIGSFHHNLLAHNYGRNWSIGGGLSGDGYYTGRLDIRNNVVYNWGHRTTDGGANAVNFVNNYYKPGASTKFFYALNAQHEGVGKGKQQYYFKGNKMLGYFDEKNQEKGRKMTLSHQDKVDYETFVDQPFFESHVTTQSAEAAYKDVLSDVGANQPVVDAHDARIVAETRSGTYHFKGSKSGLPGMIDTEQDAGGWPVYATAQRAADWDTDHDGLPDWWEEVQGLNPNSPAGDFTQSNSDADKDGFTQLDDYLDWMAQPHYFIKKGEAKALAAGAFFSGYTKKPVYAISDSKNGKATIKGEAIQFQGDQKGLASFKLTVTDAAGDAKSRVIQLLVQ